MAKRLDEREKNKVIDRWYVRFDNTMPTQQWRTSFFFVHWTRLDHTTLKSVYHHRTRENGNEALHETWPTLFFVARLTGAWQLGSPWGVWLWLCVMVVTQRFARVTNSLLLSRCSLFGSYPVNGVIISKDLPGLYAKLASNLHTLCRGCLSTKARD